MKIVYMCHPVKGETPEHTAQNVQRAKRWVRWIYDNYEDIFVMAMWIVDCEVLDDHNPVHRAAGMMRNSVAVPLCEEAWLVGGTLSLGMFSEMEIAFKSGRIVRDFLSFGEEPPEGPVALPAARVRLPSVELP